MIIVSACLAGINCRYDGKNSLDEGIMKLVAEGKAIPVCPEQLGGCPTPRMKAEIVGGTGKDVLERKCRIINENGDDVTEQFIKGAEEVLKIAGMTGANMAVLKAKSPSCGVGEIYNGTFSGKLVEGNGVTAELLKENGIEVKSERTL
jgi:uncharacterized protein YbbK (DUF523 family)